MAFAIDGDRRDHRDEAARDQLLYDLGVDVGNLADPAQIDQHVVAAGVFGLDQLLALAAHELIIFARKPDRASAVLTNQADDFLVYGAAEHHFDDIHRGVVGHAQTPRERRFDADALEHTVDLRP